MNALIKFKVPLLLVGSVAVAASPPAGRSAFYPAVREYITNRLKETDQIPEERKARLRELASYVKSRLDAHQPARLTFICTHNSRRSQMSQIWADAAAAFFGVAGVETFSGGTEGAAFNPRAVAALRRAGLKVVQRDFTANPRYVVRYRETGDPLTCFSKMYQEPPNPKADFCAVLTCSQADKSCPVITGSSSRVAIFYDDPKLADGTPREADSYDERSKQICREMLYVFSQL